MWEQLVLHKPHKKKLQGFISGLRGDQKYAAIVMIKKWFDMTQGPKPLFKNSSMTFAVCDVAPSCINHSVCRGKPFVIS
jgi:hypothetical protein